MPAIRYLSICSALTLCMLAPAAMAQDAGRMLAQKLCVECHAIGPGEASKGAAPAFAAVAAMPSATRLALKVFLRSPHASMPAIMLSDSELDTLADYILSLAGK